MWAFVYLGWTINFSCSSYEIVVTGRAQRQIDFM